MVRIVIKNIVIVDDDPSVRYTVKTGIEMLDESYHIKSVDGGIKCLEILKTGEIPDLILLDVMMPEMSGWKTFDLIKKNELWKDIPIIFLTARTDRIAKNAGGFLAEDYIEKPAKIPELKKRIDKILNKK